MYPSSSPHVCGENFGSTELGANTRLRSPHVCGDNRLEALLDLCIHSVHPHVCGDNYQGAFNWGRVSRFTPTYVGTTFSTMATAVIESGSPPRMWGQPTVGLSVNSSSSVHPHVCGDNWRNAAICTVMHEGSPPRMWGQRFGGKRNYGRLIGSPPRMWGQHATEQGTKMVSKRFTPTYVGTTQRRVREVADRTRFTPTYVGTTDATIDEFQSDVRFTPTYVGTTPH